VDTLTLEPVTTWRGVAFGWIGDGGLFANDGRHVGQIYRDIIYAEGGNYLGELLKGRLITDTRKKDTHRWYGFIANPEPCLGPADSLKPQPAWDMPDESFEDFPIAL
jgi:hypothetical protein